MRTVRGGVVPGVVLGLVLAGAAPAAAGPDGGFPWEGEAFTADPLALAREAARRPVRPRGQADVLLEEHRLVFDAEGRETRSLRLVYVPPPSDPRSWATVHRVYGPWYQARPEIRARVVSPQGEVRWLDPATLTDGVVQREGDVFTDLRAVEGPLPAVEPGAVVEEEHLVRGTAPFFAAGSASFIDAERYPVHRFRVRVEAPAGAPLQVVAHGLPPLRESRAGGRRVLELEVEDLPAAIEREPWLPPEQARRRGVAIGTGRSWGEVARAYAAIAERQLEGADLAATARSILAPGDDARTASAKVLAWIAARTRYTGLSLGERGLVPARPGETLERRYGDCKDLSLLAVGLLRAAGHRAALVLLRTADDEVDVELPGLGQFDHAVVRVEARPPVWLDPADGHPAGLPGFWAQGKLALVAEAGTRALVRAPEAGPADNRFVRTRRIELAEQGPGRAREETWYRGGMAAWLRRRALDLPPAEREKTARARFNAAEGSAVVVAPVPADDGGSEVRFLAEAEASRWSHTGDDRAEVVVSPDPVFEWLPELLRTEGPEEGADGGRREGPLEFRMPYRAELTYQLVTPPGFRAQELPPAERFEVGSAAYQATFTALDGGDVEVAYRFQTGRRFQPREVDALRHEVGSRTREDGPRIHYQRLSRTLLDAGRGREALDELRRLVALHPREARHHNHLALALLSLGMGESARAEARRAVALEPGEEWGHRVLAHVLQRDLVGQAHAPGADLAGALAELRTARDLAPRSALIRGLLAEALVTSEGGERFGVGAPQLEEALAGLRYAHEVLKSTEHDEAYARLLLQLGKGAEALKVARGAPERAGRNGVLLAAAQLAEGFPAMQREGRALPAAAIGPAFQAAAVELWQARAYPQLAAIFEASARAMGTVPPEVLAAQQVIGRVRRAETLTFDRADPLQVPQLYFQAMLLNDPARLRELSAEGAAPEPARVEEFRRGVRAALGTQWGSLSRQVSLDGLLGNLKVEAEPGGPPWRLHLTSLPFGADALGREPRGMDSMMVLVQERGLPRVASLDPSPAGLGLLALRLASGGDEAGARRVLGWAQAGLRGGAPLALGALWTPGDKAGRAEVLRAAAALGAYAPGGAAQAIPLLLEERARASGDARRELSRALLVALVQGALPDRAAALAREVAAEEPALLADARRAEVVVAIRTQRLAEARALAEDFLARQPGTPALRMRAGVELPAGDYPALERLHRQILEAKDANGGDWNNAAWNQLFLGEPGAAALELGQRAVKETGGRSAGTLHTLAALQAFAGQPAEAMSTLQRAVRLEGAVRSEDWLVVGRVAETYGLAEDAVAAYRRVEAPRGAPGGSSWELARRRLANLAPAEAPR